MTLNEAIKHCEEVADGHDRIKQIKAVTLEECKRASEHRQLAEWLKELKRLREQTDGDLISRKSVITMLQKIENAVEDGDGFQFNEWIEYAKDIPSAEKTAEWIPVKDRMPEFNDIVLASADSDYDELRVIITIYKAEEFWFNGTIKAWMPLPYPYKAESGEEE